MKPRPRGTIGVGRRWALTAHSALVLTVLVAPAQGDGTSGFCCRRGHTPVVWTS